MADADLERILALARQADTMRLERVAATRVLSHRAHGSVPVRAAALALAAVVTFSTGPALILAGTGAAAGTRPPAVAVGQLPQSAWVCCQVAPPGPPVVVAAEGLRLAPAPLPSPTSGPTSASSAQPVPSPTVTGMLLGLPTVLPVVPAVSRSASATPGPSPTLSPSATLKPSASASTRSSVSPSAGPGCALPPS